MTKQGDWSEAHTRLCREERPGSRPSADIFGQEGDRTVLEASDSIAARANAPVSAPRIPRIATPQPPASIPYLTTRVPTPRSEPSSDIKAGRRLTLTPLPGANPASIPVPPLAPISRQPPLAPPRAQRPELGRYRLVGLVALTGLALGITVLHLARAMF